MSRIFRPRLHVSGFVCIRKHFVADSKLYTSTRIRIRCVFERPHVSVKTIQIRYNCLESMRHHICRLNSSVNLCNETRLIRIFSLHSSGATIWLTKPVHQAFARPGLTQNLQGRAWRLLFRRLTDTFLATGVERSHTKVARILS